MIPLAPDGEEWTVHQFGHSGGRRNIEKGRSVKTIMFLCSYRQVILNDIE